MPTSKNPPGVRLISAAAIFFVIALALGGGASRDDELAYIVVPVASSALLAAILFSRWIEHPSRVSRPLLFLAAIAAVALSQLLPLPPAIWQNLPGRDIYTRVGELANAEQAWRPISLSPDRTTDFLLSLLPIAAAMVLVSYGDQRFVRGAVKALVILATLSTILAALQLGDGPSSALRFYRISNIDSGVGFFANRNHQATLLAVAIPAAGWWIITPRASRVPPFARLAIGVGCIVLFIIGGFMTGSRMGLALCIFALAATIALVWPRVRRGKLDRRFVWGVGVGLSVLATAVVALSLTSGHRALEGGFTDDLRAVIWPPSIDAAETFFPTGAGFGTFDRVYPRFERVEGLRPEYVNRAHNDLIEIGIEGGLPAYILLTVLLVWLVYSSTRVWRHSDPAPGVLTGRLASIIVFLVLAASTTDYPMRTALIATVFASACVILERRIKESTDASSNVGETAPPSAG